jgi:chromosome segregation ATPase
VKEKLYDLLNAEAQKRGWEPGQVLSWVSTLVERTTTLQTEVDLLKEEARRERQGAPPKSIDERDFSNRSDVIVWVHGKLVQQATKSGFSEGDVLGYVDSLKEGKELSGAYRKTIDDLNLRIDELTNDLEDAKFANERAQERIEEAREERDEARQVIRDAKVTIDEAYNDVERAYHSMQVIDLGEE